MSPDMIMDICSRALLFYVHQLSQDISVGTAMVDRAEDRCKDTERRAETLVRELSNTLTSNDSFMERSLLYMRDWYLIYLILMLYAVVQDKNFCKYPEVWTRGHRKLDKVPYVDVIVWLPLVLLQDQELTRAKVQELTRLVQEKNRQLQRLKVRREK